MTDLRRLARSDEPRTEMPGTRAGAETLDAYVELELAGEGPGRVYRSTAIRGADRARRWSSDRAP